MLYYHTPLFILFAALVLMGRLGALTLEQRAALVSWCEGRQTGGFQVGFFFYSLFLLLLFLYQYSLTQPIHSTSKLLRGERTRIQTAGRCCVLYLLSFAAVASHLIILFHTTTPSHHHHQHINITTQLFLLDRGNTFASRRVLMLRHPLH